MHGTVHASAARPRRIRDDAHTSFAPLRDT
jgi:hypothetical protein